MKARTAPWTTAALAMACAGLGAAVVFELTGGLSLAPEVTAAPPSVPEVVWSQEPIEFAAPSQDEIEETAARPLFSPSRRPFVAQEEEEAPAPVQPLPSVQLIGVLVTERQRAALVQRADGSKPSWVREGTDVGGWQIEKIEHSRVQLRAGDRLDTVELRPDTAVPAKARPKPRRARAEKQETASNEDGARASKAESGNEEIHNQDQAIDAGDEVIDDETDFEDEEQTDDDTAPQ